jgi:molybdopterin/thiamine biosynthesis adenylyltransferase
MVFDHQLDTPCYQCIFPQKPAEGLASTCAEAGVFSTLPGVVGTLMAAEAIKQILNVGNGLQGVMLIYDSMQSEIRSIKLKKADNCRVCSNGKN